MLQLKLDGEIVDIKQWKFPAGESGVKIQGWSVDKHIMTAEIIMKWEDDADLMALGQLVDAVHHNFSPYKLYLNIPYFPYSRQDRRCNLGEGHALRVVGHFINSLKFDRVITLDAHSSVLEAIVDNLIVVEQNICAEHLPIFDYLIAPDNGASKKIMQHTQVVQELTGVLIANKIRTLTGVAIEIPNGTLLENKSVCVVDDLCDGGATFLSLAEALPLPPKSLSLYVTHGFFTKGVAQLLKYYDTIYVHNLMNPSVANFVQQI